MRDLGYSARLLRRASLVHPRVHQPRKSAPIKAMCTSHEMILHAGTCEGEERKALGWSQPTCTTKATRPDSRLHPLHCFAPEIATILPSAGTGRTVEKPRKQWIEMPKACLDAVGGVSSLQAGRAESRPDCPTALSSPLT
ncbi:hypothetical protein L226DRAFT_38879 [Lentinus tigrinus ALCF2SS1-7]|uniref:Uncharacterized protein n=1 Tax=Lentinus tigrinus ALCF2SS1-6 TaxID=1328759 RepID=A0A5C2SLJ2_9APHY|nr:hypothetical protein L227DRAFT_264028 [Lentinus tigrinus ALCF2SS1-6]RPD82844.1 hypothetical protein L226DRAFT_38879 [Lentinus tigrinus ALCF2SS1-7]